MKHITYSIAIASLFLSGCIAVPVTTVNPVVGSPTVRLADRLCVVAPQDASSDDSGSGRAVAQQIVESLARIGLSASIVMHTTEARLKEACFERGANLALMPEILFYEDNLTGWSGKPDRIELRISAFKPGEQSARRVVIFEASSNTLASAFLEWGNAKPYALISNNADQVLKTLVHGSQ